MKEIKLFDDNVNALSMFRDNHLGVVVQLYRYSTGLVSSPDGVLVEKRSKIAIKVFNVHVLDANNNLKKADIFKQDVRHAVDLGYKELQKIQSQDHMIEGVLTDYVKKV